MEKKSKCVKVGFSRILWSVTAILLCAAPCGALTGNQTVDSVGTLNLGTDYGPDKVGVDDGWVDVYGTLNMHPGAYVDCGIYAYPGNVENAPGGIVNVYGCAPGNTLWVLEPTTSLPGLPPVVTVYGPNFKVGNTNYFPPTDMPISGLLEVLSESDVLLFSLTIYSDIDIHLRAPDSGGPEEITIDIKPGSETNTINLGLNGVIPVAILSEEGFDATMVPPENVFLAGLGVRVRGKGNKYLASEEDVNGDGLIDLVVKVESENLDPGQFAEGVAYLRVHETSDPTSAVLYEGWDEVVIVPPE